MKSNWDTALNFFLIAIVFLLIGGIETTIWIQFFGQIVSPMLWLSVVAYLILYRPSIVGVLYIYFCSLMISGFSLMPLKMILLPMLALFMILQFIKRRVFWSGASYFVIVTFLSVIFYQGIYMIMSHWLESNPAQGEWGSRFLMLLLTPLFSYPVYMILSQIDRWTHSEHLQDSGGLEL